MSHLTRYVVVVAALTACCATTAHAYYYANVDEALGGPMQLQFLGWSVSGDQVTENLQETNTGGSTLPDVNFSIDYAWNAANLALAWSSSDQQWGAGALSIVSTTPSLLSLSMSRSVTNIPLSWTIDGGNTGTLQTTDSMPDVALGDFAPGQSKTFTVVFGNPGLESFTSVGFAVSTVPEPATLSLLALGGLALLRRKKSGRAAGKL